jgi:hypothetical protein
MPAVPIISKEQYEKAIEVLTRVGGVWQGVGQRERILLVSQAQYKALLEADLVTPGKAEGGRKRAKNSRAAG